MTKWHFELSGRTRFPMASSGERSRRRSLVDGATRWVLTRCHHFLRHYVVYMCGSTPPPSPSPLPPPLSKLLPPLLPPALPPPLPSSSPSPPLPLPPPARPDYRSLRESRRRVQLTARLLRNVYARRSGNTCPTRSISRLSLGARASSLYRHGAPTTVVPSLSLAHSRATTTGSSNALAPAFRV